jgi:hypothetical protein
MPAIGTRTDKRFCGSTCRSRAWRSNRGAAADELLSILSGETEPTRWTDSSAVDNPTRAALTAQAAELESFAAGLTASLNGRGWQQRLDQIREHRRDLLGAFGEAVLVAAAQPVSAGTCRTCRAIMYAKRHELPAPQLDAAAMRLLGSPCSHCAPSVRQSLVASVHPPGSAAVAERPAARTPVSLPGPGHDASSCRVCVVADLAQSLVAAGSYGPDGQLDELARRALQPHAAQPGPVPVSLYRRAGQWRLRYAK